MRQGLGEAAAADIQAEGSQAESYLADVSAEADIHNAIEQAVASLGPVAALVAAAGILDSTATGETRLEDWNG